MAVGPGMRRAFIGETMGTNGDTQKLTSKIRIRDAELMDAPVLAAAERSITEVPGFLVSRPFEIVDEKFTAKIQALTDNPRGKYLVAEYDGKPVGHGMLDPLSLQAICHIVHLTLVVHPGWQGKGIGKVILRALIDWAKQASAVEKIELHVRSANTNAQALYRKMGFLDEGRWTRRIKINQGEYLDDILMGLWVK